MRAPRIRSLLGTSDRGQGPGTTLCRCLSAFAPPENTGPPGCPEALCLLDFTLSAGKEAPFKMIEILRQSPHYPFPQPAGEQARWGNRALVELASGWALLPSFPLPLLHQQPGDLVKANEVKFLLCSLPPVRPVSRVKVLVWSTQAPCDLHLTSLISSLPPYPDHSAPAPGLPSSPQTCRGCPCFRAFALAVVLTSVLFLQMAHAHYFTSFNSAPMSPSLTSYLTWQASSHLYLGSPTPLTLLHSPPFHCYCLKDASICLFTMLTINYLSLLAVESILALLLGVSFLPVLFADISPALRTTLGTKEALKNICWAGEGNACSLFALPNTVATCGYLNLTLIN